MTRRIPLAALALACAAAAISAQAIRYAPGEFRYGVITVIKRSDSQGGQVQDYTVTATQAMTLLLTPRGADTLRLRITLDAYTLGSDLPIQLPPVAQYKGTVVEGVVSTFGRMFHFTYRSPNGGTDAAQLADNMSRFLLAISADAANGLTTTDTTSSRTPSDAGEVTERTITTTKVDGDTLYDGQKAWRIRRETLVTVVGNTVQGGHSLKVTGGGTGSGTFYLSTKGVYLGAVTRSTTTTTLTLPDGSSTVGAQDATSTITLVTK